MVKLRGVLSMGILFTKEDMVRWCQRMEEVALEEHISDDFDTVCGELFVKAYVPMRKESKQRVGSSLRKNVVRFDRLMIYRVSVETEGRKKELDVADVQAFSDLLVERMRVDGNEGWKRIIPMPILYHGTLAELIDKGEVDLEMGEGI